MHVEFVKANEIENEWRTLEKCNKHIPYEKYDFMSSVSLSTTDKELFKRKVKEYTAILYDDNNMAKMILPLVLQKSGKKCICTIRGYLFGAGHLDLICRTDVQYEDFYFLISEIQKDLDKKYKTIIYKFYRVREGFRLYHYMNRFSKNHNVTITTQRCVTFKEFESFDNWKTNVLSKNNRRRITKNYNRLKKNGIEYRVDYFLNKKVPSDIYIKLIEIQAKRTIEKTKEVKLLNVVLEKYLINKKKNNSFIKALNSGQGTFTAILYLNSEIAAYITGLLYEEDRKIVFPRFSIDSSFSFYSPGTILICEMIKDMYSDNSIICNIDELNFSCGAEEYKYRMGGKEFLNYQYEFKS